MCDPIVKKEIEEAGLGDVLEKLHSLPELKFGDISEKVVCKILCGRRMESSAHGLVDLADSLGCGEILSRLCAAPVRKFPDISDKVISEILRIRRLKSIARKIFGWTAAAAACAAVITGVILFGGDGSDVSSAAADNAEQLASIQGEDGFWSPSEFGGSDDFKLSVTGLAMLAMMRAKTAGDSAPEICDSVMRAADSICETQKSDGSFGDAEDITGHAIATVALLKLYSSGTRADLFGKIDAALAYIRKRESSHDSWSSAESSDSARIWLVSALGMATDMGWKDNGGYFRRSLRYLESRPGMDKLASASDIRGKVAVLRNFCSEYRPPVSGRLAGGDIYGILTRI